MDNLSEIASVCLSGVAVDEGENSQWWSQEVLAVLTDRVVVDQQGKLQDPNKEK